MALVAAPRELLGVGPRWLPLVRPYRLEVARRRHLELRVIRVVVAVQGEPESADAREELGDLDRLVVHVSPFAAVDC